LPRAAIRQGRIVFTEGEAATGVWVVLAGRVRLVRTSTRGRERCCTLNRPAPRWRRLPCSPEAASGARARAGAASRLSTWPGPAILALCGRRPEVALGVIAVLARRLRAFAALIEDLALRDVTARLARFLLGEARRVRGDVVDLPGTREEMAARLGTVRELVS